MNVVNSPVTSPPAPVCLQDVSPDTGPEPTESTPPELQKTLQAVSYIGAAVSICCLTLTVVTYLSSKSVHQVTTIYNYRIHT